MDMSSTLFLSLLTSKIGWNLYLEALLSLLEDYLLSHLGISRVVSYLSQNGNE